jgi:AcrR family transcriptional regulator
LSRRGERRSRAGAASEGVRADARRNREAILVAAEDVFGSAGPSASTEQVARGAGVAVGTVFRHFPTKEALIAAVFARRLRALTAEARRLADDRDPGAAFSAFLEQWAAVAATKHQFAETLARSGIDVAKLESEHAAAMADLMEAIAALLARAQAAGAVRPDVRLADLRTLLVATAHAAEFADDDAARSRVLGVIVDGLRSSRRARPG